MNWIISSVFAMLCVSLYSILFMLPDSIIKENNNLQFFYIRIILILVGFICILSLFIPGLSINNELINDAKNNFNVYLIVTTAITIFLFFYFLLNAFSEGGSISTVIVNINMILIILFGIFYMREKTNIQMIIGIVLYLLIGTYIIIEKNRLN